MQKVIFIFLLCSAYFNSNAQVIGIDFPDLEGETVEDKKILIPENTKGKYTLLGMAYSKKSEDDLKTWFQPVFNKFLQQPSGLFADFGYDVNVYFIPMFTGVKAAGMGAAKRKAIKKVDSNLHPYILFYKGDLGKFKDALDFEKRDIPYFFVLDKNGKIIYATSGGFSQKKLNDIEAVLE